MKKYSLILGIIIFLGIFLRLFYLDKIPVELFGDELDVGYQAYSILKTGKDIRGYYFPFYFHSLSESRAPLYLYVTIPFITIFGLNEWGVRLPAAFFGILNIFLLYLLVKKLFQEEKLALISAFLLAVTPWHIHYSRAGFEVTLLLTLILGGIFFWKKGKYPISIVFFLLSFYTYSTAVLFLLLFIPILFFLDKIWEKIQKKDFLVTLLVFLVGMTPFLFGFLSGQAGERFFQISIFNDQKLVGRIINKRGSDLSFGRFFHNKATEIGKEFLSNYLNAFSPDFLFLKGDPNPRHSVGTTGELYLIYLPFLIFGLIEVAKNTGKRENLFLLGWLLISPVPSALTIGGGNHATRLFLMLPVLVLFIAIGVAQSWSWIKKTPNIFKFLVVIFTFSFFIYNFVSYLHQYYVHYPQESWQFWHYGYKEAMKKLSSVENQYQKIVLNNNQEPILIRFLFWGHKDPSWFRNNFKDDKDIPKVLGNFDGFRIDKYFFVKPQKTLDFLEILDNQTLYLGFQKDDIPGDWDFEKKPPPGVKVVETIKDFFGNPYIYLLTKSE